MIKNAAIDSALQTYVDAGKLAGVATAIWKRGELVAATCAGVQGIETPKPVMPNTIFRIASLTKPVTSVAALMLVDERRLALEEPITRWAPEFRNMLVLRAPEGPLEDTEPAHRPITFEDLLTHRAGFTYGPFHHGPIAAAYAQTLGADIDNPLTPDAWIERLASLPLLQQPGSALRYGHSTDLLGMLLERIEDAPLSEILRRRVFGPLGMTDTGFTVSAAHANRKAGLVGFDASGALMPLTTCPGGSTVAVRPEGMNFFSGGQGLWSTVLDFGRFARLFAENGSVDGVRLLQPETLKSMTTNRLTADQRTRSLVGEMPLFAAGHGFGLGVAVVMEPRRCLPTICRGGEGTVGWPGGFGGWWQADPTNGTVMVFLCHNMLDRQQFARGIGMSVYEAISQFHALGTELVR